MDLILADLWSCSIHALIIVKVWVDNMCARVLHIQWWKYMPYVLILHHVSAAQYFILNKNAVKNGGHMICHDALGKFTPTIDYDVCTYTVFKCIYWHASISEFWGFTGPSKICFKIIFNDMSDYSKQDLTPPTGTRPDSHITVLQIHYLSHF